VLGDQRSGRLLAGLLRADQPQPGLNRLLKLITRLDGDGGGDARLELFPHPRRTEQPAGSGLDKRGAQVVEIGTAGQRSTEQ
jgi:hypothetical protein